MLPLDAYIPKAPTYLYPYQPSMLPQARLLGWGQQNCYSAEATKRTHTMSGSGSWQRTKENFY